MQKHLAEADIRDYRNFIQKAHQLHPHDGFPVDLLGELAYRLLEDNYKMTHVSVVVKFCLNDLIR